MENKVEGIYDGFKELGTGKIVFVNQKGQRMCIKKVSTLLTRESHRMGSSTPAGVDARVQTLWCTNAACTMPFSEQLHAGD